MLYNLFLHLSSFCLIQLLSYVNCDAVISLRNDNVNSILGSNEIVFVNFYADWCRFSQILAPVFAESAQLIKNDFPQEGKVTFAKVDCDSEVDIASKYHISKYPTLKLFRNGEITKKEFRGQRNAQVMADFIKDQLRDSVEEAKDLEELDDADDSRRIIGHYATKDCDAYRTLSRVAGQLRDNCKFYAAFGAVSQNERTNGDNVVFRPPTSRRQDVVYMGDINNLEMLTQWAVDKCVPVVREITFENAEELTEEGLPFLILFHKPEDTPTVELFSKEVARQLLTEKNSINCLTADGNKFSHPLHHLGKSYNDLPILAIDSFRHMYIFPHSVTDIAKPGLLKQFIADLHSGKLHREFHHGPDPITSSPPPPQDAHKQEDKPSGKEPVKEMDKPETPTPVKQKTQPPVSTFQKLKPSSDRYTILRDEL